MKYTIKKFTAVLLSAVLLFSALTLTSSAAHTHILDITFTQTADGNTLISLILPTAEKLTAIDFSLILTSDTAKIKELSTENTDLKGNIFDFDNLPEDKSEKIIFTYTTTEKPGYINFSGFFLEYLTTDKSFHLCDIIISSDAQFTEKDIFEFICTLSCEECSTTMTRSYSLKSCDIIHKNMKPSFASGDTDLNGTVDSTDARHILRASVGLDELMLEQVPFADSDFDGKITAADARFALRLSVGLEQKIVHSFDISLEEGKKCEDGGNYTFTCRITNISFSMEIANGGHIFNNAADCLNPAICEVCDEEIYPAIGHTFDESGVCSMCAIDKSLLDEAKTKLLALLEDIHTYDALAEEAIALNQKTNFISYTQEATKIIRKAAEACKGIADLKAVSEHLTAAYNIRFQVFISVMDEEGNIRVNTENCNAILSAVTQSKEHIAYTSFLYE